jgi:SEC-C motif
MADKPALLLCVDNVREEMIENSQLVLGEGVDSGAPWAIRYTLKTIGAKRGYGGKESASSESKAAKEQATADSPPPAPDAPRPVPIANPLIPPTLLTAFASAVQHFKGHLTLTAIALRMTRAQLKAIVGMCPRMQAELGQVRESLVDIAELMLQAAIREKKSWAVCFSLNTLGRKLGFGPPARTKMSGGSGRVGEGSAEPTAPIADTTGSDTLSSAEPSSALPGPQEHLDTVGSAKPSPTRPESGLPNAMATLPRVGGQPEIARNAQCPCNSGRKYKRCCGAI